MEAAASYVKSVETTSLERAAVSMRRKFGDHHKLYSEQDDAVQSLVVSGEWRRNMVVLNVVTATSFVSETKVGHGIHLLIPFASGFSYSGADGKWRHLSRNEAVICSPRQRYGLKWPTRSRALAIRIHETAIDAFLAKTGSPPRAGQIRFAPIMRLDNVEGTAFMTLVEALLKDLNSPRSLFSAGITSDNWTILIVAALANTQENNLDLLAHSSVDQTAPGFVHDALEYINANLGDGQVGRDEVVTAAGVPARTLHYWFNKLFGMGPVAYARDLRLRNVRDDLVGETSKCQPIGDIAARWGFYDGSAFANFYRARFGELPSETVRRAHAE